MRETKKDIVFLFGAGASFGAGGILPENPPLGSQLYKELERIYPSSWGSFDPNCKKYFYTNFETGMDILYNRYSTMIPELMQQMAIYLIQFRPYQKGSTLYCKLIRTIRDSGIMERVLFSSLNYDCVLEFSLVLQRYGISYFDEGRQNTVPVWKLHGSSNMFCKNINMTRGVSYSKGVIIEGGVQAFLDIGTVVENCIGNSGLSPVMCLYMRGKPLQISPSVIVSVQKKWQELISQSSKIFLIGINPLADDHHIWEPLRETSSPLYIIGSEDKYEQWANKYRKENFEFLSQRFNTGFNKIMEILL
ncbi:MAG: hypothetical protein ACTSR2_14155 [Candidatus Hodarchaeales archaeon]